LETVTASRGELVTVAATVSVTNGSAHSDWESPDASRAKPASSAVVAHRRYQSKLFGLAIAPMRIGTRAIL
jgi:hypothetical protein